MKLLSVNCTLLFRGNCKSSIKIDQALTIEELVILHPCEKANFLVLGLIAKILSLEVEIVI